ncbi:MAG TPA: hypothetical protein ACFYEK_06575 [Candidatus Wunengus sp. YC60]|uniref:hypothetical protein n=1 Tax=Candidatus Wunengus sp. YC60 TaxID=3367697 RepID=UPI0040268DB9
MPLQPYVGWASSAKKVSIVNEQTIFWWAMPTLPTNEIGLEQDSSVEVSLKDGKLVFLLP